MLFSIFTRRNRQSLVQVVLILLLVSGCGVETYEQRLKETRDYYAYVDKLESNLSPVWGDHQGEQGQNIVELRPPKQFVSIPAPTAPQPGDQPVSVVDPRQPDYINLVFPQLLGAWETTVNVPLDPKLNSGGANSKVSRKAYIYALSNYWQLVSNERQDAPQFTKALTTLLESILRVPVKDQPPEMYPKISTFFPSQNYNVYRSTPKPITFQDADKLCTVNYLFEIYERQSGDLSCQIVVVTPEGIDPKDKVNERISMMLETVRPPTTAPRAPQSAPGPANAAPTGSPTGPAGF